MVGAGPETCNHIQVFVGHYSVDFSYTMSDTESLIDNWLNRTAALSGVTGSQGFIFSP